VSYENYVVGATSFISMGESDEWLDSLRNVNRFVIKLMSRRGYSPNETSEWEVEYRKPTLTMTFSPSGYNVKPSIQDKAIGVLRMQNKIDRSVDYYHKLLKRTMDEVPAKIVFIFDILSVGNVRRGVKMRIEVEPTILLKHRVFGKTLHISKDRYDSIMAFETRFMTELVASLPCTLIEGPKVLRPRDTFRQELMENLSDLGLPKEVSNCLELANGCFASELYLPCSVMIRKAIEVGVTKKFYQTGNERRMFDRENNEVSLEKKFNLLVEINPKLRRDIDQMRLVKWLGDKAAHDPLFDVLPGDIKDNLPRVMSFLNDLGLKQ
jgi:hypothetical protein